jgi:hypothetical protein
MMAIKREADDAHFMSHPEEREVALRLDEGFNITFGRPHGELAKWLAEPTPHVAERFGFAKELLVIYSRHQRTDARVLTTAAAMTKEEREGRRTDPAS